MSCSVSRVIAVVGFLTLPLAASGQSPTKPADPETAFRARAEEALAKKLDWVFQKRPLDEVIQWLSTKTGIPFRLDVKKLDDVGVEPKTLVTFKLRNASLRAGLYLMLRQFELTWRIGPGTIVVTTPEDAEADIRARVYPVRDLILVKTSRGEGLDFDMLIDLITTTVAPQSWETGQQGLPEVGDHSIVVRQTDDVHEHIAALLAMYREVRKDFAVDATKTARPWYGDATASKTWNALQVVESRVVDMPLDELIEEWSKVAGMPFFIDEKKLDEIGVRPNFGVTGEYHEATLFTGMVECLKPFDLGIKAVGDVVVVTTPEDAESKQTTRIYPVYDLTPPEKHRPRPWEFGHSTADGLVDAVTQSASPHSWDTTGGPCSISAIDNPPALVISATLAVHNEVDQLLTEIRSKRPPRTKEPAVDPEKYERRVLVLQPSVAHEAAYQAAPPAANPKPDGAGPAGVQAAPAEAKPIKLTPPPDAKVVAQLIAKYVAPESWEAKGADMDLLESRLILTNKRRVLDEAEDFLIELGIRFSGPSVGVIGFGGGGGFF